MGTDCSFVEAAEINTRRKDLPHTSSYSSCLVHTTHHLAISRTLDAHVQFELCRRMNMWFSSYFFNKPGCLLSPRRTGLSPRRRLWRRTTNPGLWRVTTNPEWRLDLPHSEVVRLTTNPDDLGVRKVLLFYFQKALLQIQQPDNGRK